MSTIPHIITGYIGVVQGRRFRTATDDGQGLLFTLAIRASTNHSDLDRLCPQHARVRVEYAGEPSLGSGVTYTVQPTTA